MPRAVSVIRVVLAGVWLTAFGCGASPVAPTAPVVVVVATPASLTGTWSGPISDTQGLGILTWSLTQTGDAVSGTVLMNASDTGDGTCASCHKEQHTGAVVGTLSGSTLAFTMTLPGTTPSAPTPICSINASGTAQRMIEGEVVIIGAYTGADSCEGPFAAGTLIMRAVR
jgi:hypothetical protein